MSAGTGDPMRGDARDAAQLAGRMITITLLRVLEASPAAVGALLERRLRAAPSLAGLPAVLDLEPLGGAAAGLDLAALAAAVQARDITLLGVRDSGETARALAQAAGLPVLRMDGARIVHRGSEPQRRDAPGPDTAGARTLTVTQPVRSGQQVYARGGDLVLLGPVSAGAEVMADGNIHAYGRLRGRAIAGAQGDREARIFCQRLEAELVAIAGYYRLSEEPPGAQAPGPVQIRLQGESLLIEPL